MARPAQRLTLQGPARRRRELELPVVTDSREAAGRRVGVLGIRGGNTEFEPLGLPQACGAGSRRPGRSRRRPRRRLADADRPARHRGTRRAAADRPALRPGGRARRRQPGLLHRRAVGQSRAHQPVPDPGPGWRPSAVLSGRGVRGRPIPPRAQEYGFRAGLALLVGLFVFATWNDLAHIGLFRWVAVR